MPVLSIHGNHDDPIGEGESPLCSLNLLAAAGYVNYFGRQIRSDDIQLKPLLFTKNDTHVAIYGLGNMRDKRLYSCFEKDKVQVLSTEDDDDYFKIFVLHQNRTPHGHKNYIPEHFLDDSFDFVFWGHEHECLIHPVHSEFGFDVCQPGSSVATALSEGEAKPKHVGVLTITKKNYELEPIRLKTPRIFLMEEVELMNVEGLVNTDVHRYLSGKVQGMIEKSRIQWDQENPDSTEDYELPLIRLKVEYTGFDTLNPIRFGQAFVSKVANPHEILLFYKKRTTIARSKKADTNPDMPESFGAAFPEINETDRIAKIVEEFLGAQSLSILPENQLQDAVVLFVEKDDKDAISKFVKLSLEKTRKKIDIEKIDFIEDEKKFEAKVKATKAQQYTNYKNETFSPEKKEGEKTSKKTVAKKGKKKVVEIVSSEEESEVDVPVIRSKGKQNQTTKAVIERVQDSQEEEEDHEMQTSVGNARRTAMITSDDDEVEEEEVAKVGPSKPVPSRRAPKKVVPAVRARVESSEDEIIMSDDAVEVIDDEEEEPVLPPKGRGKGKAAKPAAKKPKKAAAPKKAPAKKAPAFVAPKRSAKVQFSATMPEVDDEEDEREAFSSLKGLRK